MVKVALALLCLLLSQLASSEDYIADIDPNDNLTEEEFEKFFHVDPADDPEEEERRAEALAKNEEYVKEINEQYIDEEIDWFDKVNEEGLNCCPEHIGLHKIIRVQESKTICKSLKPSFSFQIFLKTRRSLRKLVSWRRGVKIASPTMAAV